MEQFLNCFSSHGRNHPTVSKQNAATFSAQLVLSSIVRLEIITHTLSPSFRHQIPNSGQVWIVISPLFDMTGRNG